jgi:hypothetical protein
MWTFPSQSVDRGTIRFSVSEEGRVLCWREVLALWRDSASFRSGFNAMLAAVPFAAYRWETPPVTADDLQADFQFVLAESPELLAGADPSPFADHFRRAGSASVIVFPNLGGDAQMVVPCPLAPHSTYAHLAAFVRGAPEAQRQALWVEVSRAMQQRLGQRPVWLSTAGGGVAWLHVRLDDRPKYYVHAPYRKYGHAGPGAGGQVA